MKLEKKIVSSATENTLLQLDRTILICSIIGLVLDVMAVCLVLQSNLKILGFILLVIVFGYIDRRFQDFLSRYDEEVSKISYDHFSVDDFKK